MGEKFLSNDPIEAKQLIGMSLSFFVGLFQILMAIFHFGFSTRYLSDVIVSGFTIGAGKFDLKYYLNFFLI